MRVHDQNVLPAIEHRFRDVELPIDSSKESSFVQVDLGYLQTRDLAPSSRRVVAILKIL
jgi:hypothetical protein